MATGVRFAFASSDPATLLSRIGGMALLVAAVVGTLTFAVSVRRLTVEPTRYGANFDFLADNGSSWYISGAPDPRWDDSDIATLGRIAGSDFEVVDTGPIVTP